MSGSLPFGTAPGYRRPRLPAGQTEFALRVPVCAWCRPVQGGEPMAVLSHGICPRHFRSLEWQMKGIVPQRRSRARRPQAENEALLPLAL